MVLLFALISLIPFNIWIYQWTKISKKPTLNIEILFDVSLSMTVKDIKPDRFYAAKESLIKFIESLDASYNIWIITFSGHPFVYIPFSNDKKALIWKIKNMKMSDFPPALDFVWTAIWDAILLWVTQLSTYTNNIERPWVIVLFTDGDSNLGIELEKALTYAKKYNIPIFVWAIWTNRDYIVWKDFYWSDVKTSIDLKVLRKIAEDSGWEFLEVKDKNDFLKILSKLYEYVRTYEVIERVNEYVYINYYIRFILLWILVIYFILFVRFNIKKFNIKK